MDKNGEEIWVGEIIDANTTFDFWPLRNVDISVESLVKINEGAQCGEGPFVACMHDHRQGNDETLAVSKEHMETIP